MQYSKETIECYKIINKLIDCFVAIGVGAVYWVCAFYLVSGIAMFNVQSDVATKYAIVFATIYGLAMASMIYRGIRNDVYN